MSFTTHFSVLSGMKNNENDAWERFYRMYASLIRLHGRDCGISVENQEDLVQNVLISLAAKMPGFNYDPKLGRFRDYLRKIIRARAADMLREYYKQERIQELPEISEVYLEKQFDDEWHEHIKNVSLERLKSLISLKHYQIFYLLDIQNRSIREVAKLHNLPQTTVYSIRQRTEKRLRTIARSLDV